MKWIMKIVLQAKNDLIYKYLNLISMAKECRFKRAVWEKNKTERKL